MTSLASTNAPVSQPSRSPSATPPAIILLYHRVVDLPDDPLLLCVTPEHFAEHLRVLDQHCGVQRLSRLAGADADSRTSRPAVAITFDDGYADNLYHARPLLDRFATPATVFVTTGPAGREREFWWDELERLLLHPGDLPEALALTIAGRRYDWALGSASHLDLETHAHLRRWNVLADHIPTTRHEVYGALHTLLRPLREAARNTILDELQRLTGGPQVVRATHRALDFTELSALTDSGLVDVGAHTATHPVLGTVTTDDLRKEIDGGKRQLEKILGKPVACFSYPYGTRRDYTPAVVTAVRDAGFALACANFEGRIDPETNRFELPRFLVRDWDGPTFARRLQGWIRS